MYFSAAVFFSAVIFLSAGRIVSDPYVVNITEQKELEQFLCSSKSPLEQDTRVVLSNSITHYISSNVSLCVINTTYSLTLTTDSSSPAVIQCNQTSNLSYWPLTGFVFTNVHNLTLQKLIFTRCGGLLKDGKIVDIINSTDSPVFFTQHQSAVLLFLHINTLTIEKITITMYYGFAVLAINPIKALFQNVFVNLAINIQVVSAFGFSLGSGILYLFTDCIEAITLISHNVTLSNAVFQSNVEYVSVVDCLSDLQHVSDSSNFPITNAAGLTIIYAQNHFVANVAISEVVFGENLGSIAGAMLILHYKTNQGKTIVNHTKFGVVIEIDNEKCKAYGGSFALVLINVFSKFQALIVDNSKFTDEEWPWKPTGNSAVYIVALDPSSNTVINVTFNNSKFIQNRISTTGACLYAKTYYSSENQYRALNIVLENIVADKNSQAGIISGSSRGSVFYVRNAATLAIRGISHFYDNYGSVFKAIDTKIKLSGTLMFARNHAECGAAFNLHGNSHFDLSHDLNATFIDNTALSKGGAIYVYDEDSSHCIFTTSFKKITKCLMTFINNEADESGSSIYGNNMYSCDLSGRTQEYSTLDKFYKSIFNFSSTSHLNDISTPSFELDYCRTVHSYVRQHKRNMPAYINPIYPGQRIMLPLYAKDKNRHNAVDYAIVTFSTGIHTKMSKRLTKLAWKVLPDDINQVLLEGRLCTIVYVTMLNYNISFNPTNAILILSNYYSPVLTIKLDKLSNCPIGFELNITEGKCVCSNLLYKFNIASDDCQISPKVNYSIPIIKRPNLIWLGLMKLPKGITVLGAAGTCYYYCKKEKKYSVCSE